MSMALKQGLILMQQQACLLDLFMPQFQMLYICILIPSLLLISEQEDYYTT